jgi:hypothetical protein
MEDNRATINKVHPDLLMSPHIMSELFQVVIGKLQLDSSQQEQMVNHLRYCEYCRTSLIVLLSAEQKQEIMNDRVEIPVHALLTQFVAIHHEIAIHDYEHMGAYAEAIHAVGRTEADKRFPVLAGHIKRCTSCQSWLEETLEFLDESEINN